MVFNIVLFVRVNIQKNYKGFIGFKKSSKVTTYIMKMIELLKVKTQFCLLMKNLITQTLKL